MAVTWDYASGQSLGGRQEQEDYCDVQKNDEAVVCVLADGMGGHAAGAMAAQLAVSHFLKSTAEARTPRSDNFLPALYASNDAIADYVSNHPDCEGMGCTLIGVELDPNGLRWISVGDSKIFWKTGNGIAQINADHSMAGRLAIAVKNGEMTEQEARDSPSRHLLLSAVTGDHISKLDYNAQGLSAAPGDVLIIATDGIDTLTLSEIDALLDRHKKDNVTTISQALIGAVADRALPRQDNTTLIVARAGHGNTFAGDSIATRPLRQAR